MIFDFCCFVAVGASLDRGSVFFGLVVMPGETPINDEVAFPNPVSRINCSRCGEGGRERKGKPFHTCLPALFSVSLSKI